MEENKEKKGQAMDEMLKDVISGIVMLALFSAFLIFSFSITEKTVTGGVSSRTMPQFISILGIIVSLYLIVTKWIGYKKKEEGKEHERNFEEPRLWKRIVVSTVLMIGYIFLINILGYIIASILYLLLQIIAIYEKRDKKSMVIIVIISIAVPLILYIPFRYVFNLMIPTGIIFR